MVDRPGDDPRAMPTGDGTARGADEDGRVRALLDAVDALPPLPPVARRLLELGDLEQADIEEVAGLIELDPGLSAGVLAMCRAAHTGLGDRISTVRHAVVMLGVDCIRRLVMSAQVRELLQEQAAMLDESGRTMALGEPAFDREGLWVHCVAVACAAERIARHKPGLVRPERAFVAGLLHGVGRLALELVAPRAMARITQYAAARGVSGAAAEGRVLGIDHHEAGRRLGDRWGLPGDVLAVIEWHDNPPGGEPAEADIVRVAALAKWICRRYHLGWSGDWGPPGRVDRLCTELGIWREDLDDLLPVIVLAVGRCMADMGLSTSSNGVGGARLAVMMANQANLLIDAAANRQGGYTASGEGSEPPFGEEKPAA